MTTHLHPNEVILTPEVLDELRKEELTPEQVKALVEQYERQTGDKLNATSG